jgi:hypothetical protein
MLEQDPAKINVELVHFEKYARSCMPGTEGRTIVTAPFRWGGVVLVHHGRGCSGRGVSEVFVVCCRLAKKWSRGLAVVHDQVEERGEGETQGWAGVRLPHTFPRRQCVSSQAPKSCLVFGSSALQLHSICPVSSLIILLATRHRETFREHN